MRKIAVVITARPSYARIKSVLQAIQDHHGLELQLILAASALLDRYGNVGEVVKADGFKPMAEVHTVLEGSTPLASAKTLGISVGEVASVLQGLQPDCVVTVADRYETLATAIAGSYLGIPVAHVQGGEISGNIDEKVRHAVTKLADLHFVASERAYERVVAMGEKPGKVFATGCPSIDLAADVLTKTDDPVLLEGVAMWCATGTGTGLGPFTERYIIAMQHPVSYEWEQAGEQVTATLSAVHKAKIPCFWFWPNIDSGADLTSKAIRVFHEGNPRAKIRFIRNMPPEAFLWLLAHASAIVGNSSAAIREGAFLGTPAVDIGSRQSGRDMAHNVMSVGYHTGAIHHALLQQIGHGRFKSSELYGDGKAGRRIADALGFFKLTTEKRLEHSYGDPRQGRQQTAAE